MTANDHSHPRWTVDEDDGAFTGYVIDIDVLPVLHMLAEPSQVVQLEVGVPSDIEVVLMRSRRETSSSETPQRAFARGSILGLSILFKHSGSSIQGFQP